MAFEIFQQRSKAPLASPHSRTLTTDDTDAHGLNAHASTLMGPEVATEDRCMGFRRTPCIRSAATQFASPHASVPAELAAKRHKRHSVHFPDCASCAFLRPVSIQSAAILVAAGVPVCRIRSPIQQARRPAATRTQSVESLKHTAESATQSAVLCASCASLRPSSDASITRRPADPVHRDLVAAGVPARVTCILCACCAFAAKLRS
jgi:hypothetical protein